MSKRKDDFQNGDKSPKRQREVQNEEKVPCDILDGMTEILVDTVNKWFQELGLPKRVVTVNVIVQNGKFLLSSFRTFLYVRLS